MPEQAELSEEQIGQLQMVTEEFLSAFSVPQDKEEAIKQLKFVFNMIIKNPNCNEMYRTIQMSNGKFRRVRDSNAKLFDFLQGIGFTRLGGDGDADLLTNNQVTFKFLKAESLPDGQAQEQDQQSAATDGNQATEAAQVSIIEKGNVLNLKPVVAAFDQKK